MTLLQPAVEKVTSGLEWRISWREGDKRSRDQLGVNCRVPGKRESPEFRQQNTEEGCVTVCSSLSLRCSFPIK